MKKITHHTIAKAIYESLKDKKGGDLDSAIKNVVLFLQKKKLLSRKKEILSEIKRLEQVEKGIIEAKVKSLSPLSESVKRELSDKIAKKYQVSRVEIVHVSDQKLIDGLIVEIGEEVIDLSAKGRTKRLENYLSSKI